MIYLTYLESTSSDRRDHQNLVPLLKALYDEAKSKGWIIISMKNDWKRIFAFKQ